MTLSKPAALPKHKIARIMAENAEKALLIATEEGTTREQGFARWRAGQLLREISKLGLEYPSNEQAQTS